MFETCLQNFKNYFKNVTKMIVTCLKNGRSSGRCKFEKCFKKCWSNFGLTKFESSMKNSKKWKTSGYVLTLSYIRTSNLFGCFRDGGKFLLRNGDVYPTFGPYG